MRGLEWLVGRSGPAFGEPHGKRLPPPVAGHDLKLNLSARGQVAGVAVEYRCVQKNIIPAILGGNEPETASLIELQHPARRQCHPPPTAKLPHHHDA